MKQFLRNVLKVLAYMGAVLVILLAIAVGLFRLFLPRLPEYQDEIKGWASDVIGMEVEFSGMDARWGLSGPQLEFYDTELIRPDSDTRVIAAEVVGVGIALDRLVFDRALVPNRILIRGTSVEIRRLESGDWWVQGSPPESFIRRRIDGPRQQAEIELVVEDIEIGLLQPGDERPRFFRIPGARVSLDEHRIALDADVRLPGELGRDLELSATQLLAVPEADRSWDVVIEASDVKLAGWSQMHPALSERLLSGEGDVALSLVYAGGKIHTAMAEVELVDLAMEEGRLFDLAGRLELDASFNGWLVAAEDFQLGTALGEWPESSLRAEVSADDDGGIAVIDVRASYLNLGDSGLLLPLLPESQRRQLEALAPTGELRDLVAQVSDLQADEPFFDVTVELDHIGFEADGKRPGVRGFSGKISGDRAGGRIEARSRDMLIDLPAVMGELIVVDILDGMVIWRSNEELTRFTTDNVHLANAVIESRGSGELTLYRDGRGPEIDVNTVFAVSDIGASRRYLPRGIMKPKLYNWFQGALLGGQVPRGTMRLNGELDRFPFDQGGGRFLLEASVRNATFKYQPLWPAAEQADMEIVLDNMRLYSVRNRSMNVGNQAVDSTVEIANLRNPVLTIEAFVTGTLESLRQFGLQSPINGFLGGNLDRLTLSGDATFKLDLTVPLKRAKETTVTGLLRSNNGTLSVRGFDPPVTDIIGEVTITREQVTSEVLGARFLGQDVDIHLRPGDDPRFFTVADVTGVITADAIVNQLGAPLEGLVSGATPYAARLLFPRGEQDPPALFTIDIESDLQGLELALPEPAGKAADRALQIRGDLRFLPDGQGIESAGFAENQIAWQLAFRPENEVWDFDRGVVTLGGDVMASADTRGLHIRGATETVRLEEWLSLSRSGERKAGAAERIRSIDLFVDDLFAIGQHLEGHHVRVDRSARDWLVQVQGDDVSGSVFVPYDFGSERAMVIEAERLRLPGDDITPPSDGMIDPRKLPPIQLTAADFALGDRHFGAVEADIGRGPDGLESTRLLTRDDTFEMVGAGRWVVDENEEEGSRTYFTATLNSTDVDATMKRLAYAPGLTGDNMGIIFDMSWSGGPRADFLDDLDGNVQLRIENGQVEEVEPGAGRMFGLLSFVALPRRLSLDFSDVFNRGFGFDSIAGNFRLVDGTAFTCDLSMEGPAANIGIVGRADLVGREYEQAAVISANVGNTLPIVGAVVGGPPGAAAMLIFSQIFRKPLQEVGQVYYGISGSWDEPAIQSANSEEFVRHGRMAGCLANETESPN